MGNCNCKPCKNNTPTKTKRGKPFSICTGNKTLIYDGNVLSVVDRKFKIPDGTYTSITFQSGCITGVGQAPLPQYTPVLCCDKNNEGGTDNTANTGTTTELSVSNETGNIASISHGKLTVKPIFNATKTTKVSGSGVASSPYKVDVKVDTDTKNLLKETDKGLNAKLHTKNTTKISLSGDGTGDNPLSATLSSTILNLPEVNKDVVSGEGYEVSKTGLVKLDPDTKFITKIKFDNEAFTVMDAGESLLVSIDDTKFKTGTSIQVADGIKGKGTSSDPLKVELTKDNVKKLLDLIKSDQELKQKLKAVIKD